MREVRIDARPRIHLGLLSLHEQAPRKNGGIGFALEGPVVEVTLRESSNLTIDDARSTPMTAGELLSLMEILERFMYAHGLSKRGLIRISGGMRTHVGMGSATAIRLAATEALALLNERTITAADLIDASGRGGTSGIGVNAYFTGGLVCDLGRPNDGTPHMPSSRMAPVRPPLALPTVPMPSWPMLLCLPRLIKSKTQQEEVAFFQSTTPLPAAASFEAAYVALFDIYAAVSECNYKAFCRGVAKIQKTAWKQAERAEYGGPLRFLAKALLDAGADCVGMSSLGPMLFCFADADHLAAIATCADTLDCDMHFTSPVNVGRHISHA